MEKRLLSLLLVLAMVLSMAPVGVFAEDAQAEAKPAVQDVDEEECGITEAKAYYGKTEDGPQTRVYVEYSLNETHSEAILVAAAYVGDRMIESYSTYVSWGGSEEFYFGSDVPKACPIRVYLLDAKTLEPLCESPYVYSGDEASAELEGDMGDLHWTLGEGCLRVTSNTGEAVELAPDETSAWDYPWSKYADRITYADLYSVSKIAKGAFAGYEQLNRVDLNNCSTEIGDMAFYGCTRLESVQMYDASITSVGEMAFAGCTRLDYVEGLEYCKTIDDHAFDGAALNQELEFYALDELGYGAFANTYVSAVTFNDACTLDIIGDGAFINCYNLSNVTLPSSVTTVGEYAFYNSRVRSINLEQVQDVQRYAFAETRPDSITLSSLENLGEYAFQHLRAEDVTVTGPIEEISAYAFVDARITRITLGDNVKTICEYAFANARLGSYEDYYGGLDVTSNLHTIEANAFVGADVCEINGADTDKIEVDSEGNEIVLALLDLPKYDDVDEEETLEASEPEETVPEETEETVPAQTEETAPAETEAPAPEETEEAAEAPADDLTAEEAADQGYYVAPEGAQMVEEAEVEEMASYEGADKVSRGVHTVTFTGLIPQNRYVLIVSTQPGSVDEEDLQFIYQAWCGDSGELTFVYIPRTDAKAIVQLYGPDKLTLEADRDYLMLQPGEQTLISLNSSYRDDSVYSVLDYEYDYDAGIDGPVFRDGDGNIVLMVNRLYLDEGIRWQITAMDNGAQEVQTYYLPFVAYGGNQTVTAKVRVDVVPDASKVTGAVLGETTVTRNVYDADATELPIFLQMSQVENLVAQQAMLGADEEETAASAYIESVAFGENTPADVQKFFTVEAKDDRTLLLRTNAENVQTAEDAKSLKSSYKGITFDVKIKGQEDVLSTQEMTLNIQKTLPKIQANAVNLNLYYIPQARVTFTGGEVLGIVEDSVKITKAPVVFEHHVDTYLDEETGLEVEVSGDRFCIDYTRDKLTGTSENVKAQVLVQGWLVPVDVTIPVKLDVKAPSLKLETNTWTIPSVGEQSTSISIVNNTKGVDMDQMSFLEEADIVDKKDNPVEGYSAYITDGVLHLSTDEGPRPAGKQSLQVRFRVRPSDDSTYAANVYMRLPITITNTDPTVKLSASTVSMNMDIHPETYLVATVTGLDEYPEYPDWNYTITGGGLKDARDLFAVEPTDQEDWGGDNWEYGLYQLKITPTFGPDDFETEKAYTKAANSTYTLTIGLGTKPTTRLTIKLTDKVPTVRLKTSGTLERENAASFLAVDSIVTNASYLDVLSCTFVRKGQTDSTEDLILGYSEYYGGYIVTAAPGVIPEAGKYTLTVQYGYYDGEEEVIVAEASTTFDVKQSKRTLKVTGKLDSYNMDSWLTVVPSYVKTYVDESENEGILDPAVRVLDPKGNVLTEGTDYNLTMEEVSDGTYYIRPLVKDGHMLTPGKYTVQLVYDKETFGEDFTLTGTFQVTQPKLKLTASGSLDSFQSWSSVALEHNFAGYEEVQTGEDEYEWIDVLPEKVTVENTNKRAQKQTLVKDEDFTVESYGGLVCLYPAEGSNIPAGTYKVTLDFGQWNGQNVTVSTNIKVTQSPVKAKLEKSSITIHPKATMEPVSVYVLPDGFDTDADWKLELCDKKGSKLEGGTNLIRYSANVAVEWEENEEDYFYRSNVLEVKGTGVVPKADTTLYLKLTPDSRVPGNYTLLTVKVLGEKSVAKQAKLTLTTKQTLDPSYEGNSIELTGSAKGFDAGNLAAKAVLQEYDGEEYVDVEGDNIYTSAYYSWYDKSLHVYLITWEDIRPDGKYRMKVDYYGSKTCDADSLIGTAITDLKVAYGSNKFTVDNAPTLYKADAKAQMDLSISAKDPSQQIGRIELKGNTGFTVRHDADRWALQYTGDTAKLKTTTLSLQIFLKGNQTAKPNATASVKVTVK